ncbi:MAG: hypothetical protein LUH19_08710 [Lachnospiraceae bacterium]|nr:hypothetical protein [Lachnospiraceae bacterium]
MAELFSFNVGLDLERKPAVSFNFVLRVEALYDLPCKSVRVFSKANEYEYVQEGGVNDYVHMLRKPISQPFTFQVERYVAVNLLDPLTNGTDLLLPVILMVNRSYKQSQIVRYYVFTGCTVTGKEFGALDSEKSGLLTETTTIAYREMFCIDNPFAGMLTGSTWGFDGTSKGGNGKRSAKHHDGSGTGVTELDQGAMQARARKWMFTDGDSARTLQAEEEEEESNGSKGAISAQAAEALELERRRLAYRGINQSAVTRNEDTKDAMEEKAQKWPPKQSAATLKTQLSREKMEERAQKWPTKQSAATTEQLSREEMEKRAQKWPPSQSAVTTEQLSKKEMEAKARLWPSEKSAVNIVSYLEQNDIF